MIKSNGYFYLAGMLSLESEFMYCKKNIDIFGEKREFEKSFFFNLRKQNRK